MFFLELIIQQMNNSAPELKNKTKVFLISFGSSAYAYKSTTISHSPIIIGRVSSIIIPIIIIPTI